MEKNGCKTTVSVEGELSNSFYVKVAYQGSAFSPILFAIVMDVLTDDVRNGSLMNLLCKDNLAF